MQPASWARDSNPHVAGAGDIETACGRSRPEAERQPAAARHVPDEEVRLIAGDVPGLRRKTGGRRLLEPMRRRVAGGDVKVEDRGRGAQTEAAGAVDEQRGIGRAGGNTEGL